MNQCLNESPYEKVGKLRVTSRQQSMSTCLNESPYEKVGKFLLLSAANGVNGASMKVPTKK